MISTALRHGIEAARARQFDRARPLLEQATVEAPDDPVAWFWLAIAAPAADAAIPCLRRVLAINPAYERAREVLANLLVSEAKAAAQAGNHAGATALATEASQFSADVQSIWLSLATVTADPVERINLLRRAADGGDPLIRTRLRQALLARGVMVAQNDRVEARARFREALALDPSDARVWQALANLADSRAEWLQALRDLVHAVPDHARGRSELRAALIADAQTLADAGSLDTACDRWREAIAFTGGDVELWLGLAAVTRDQDEAARAIESAHEMAPADPRVIEAMDRLHGPQIDPSMIEPPADAFARFAQPQGAVEQTDIAEAPVDQIEVMLGAIAGLDAAAQPNAPAAGVPAVVVERAVTVAPVVVEAPRVVEAPPVVQEPPVVEQPPVEEERASAPGNTVMVVDDSATIRKILALSLERAGYRVIAEPDGESAIDRLGHVVPDLILLDIAMPKLDGYEVCMRIKQDPRTAGVPVVMLSGKDAYFDKVKGHMAGATEYLTKPFETPAVLSVVSNFCQPSSEVTHG